MCDLERLSKMRAQIRVNAMKKPNYSRWPSVRCANYFSFLGKLTIIFIIIVPIVTVTIIDGSTTKSKEAQ